MSERTNNPVLTSVTGAFCLSLFTVAYNIAEGTVSVFFAAQDESTALLGFGADSFIESLSGAVMIWRFGKTKGGHEREQRAAVLVGSSCWVLACYIAYESLSALWFGDRAFPSIAALVIACLSLTIMPALFFLKRRASLAIRSHSLRADSHQTLACSLMSAALLVGAGLNYAFGWHWADPIAGLAIALFMVKEGHEAILKRKICTC